MCAIIKKIVRQARITFKHQDKQYASNIDKLLALTGSLTASDVGLSSRGDTLTTLPYGRHAPICHINVLEHADVTVSIFIVRKGMKLPLHDHPGMTGVIKVLYGTLKITSYKATNGCLSLDEHSSLNIIPVTKLPDVILTSSSDCQLLTPHIGNFHTIQSVGADAAMFDILSPPYDENRECNFYREIPQENKNNDTGTNTDGNCVVYLQRISQPSSFYCDQLPYTGPSIEVLSDDEES